MSDHNNTRKFYDHLPPLWLGWFNAIFNNISDTNLPVFFHSNLSLRNLLKDILNKPLKDVFGGHFGCWIRTNPGTIPGSFIKKVGSNSCDFID
jgi:hypothetical protein